jgi:hypothetical protein
MSLTHHTEKRNPDLVVSFRVGFGGEQQSDHFVVALLSRTVQGSFAVLRMRVQLSSQLNNQT